MTQTVADALLYDGLTAGATRVRARLGETGLAIFQADDGALLAIWPLADVRRPRGAAQSAAEVTVAPSHDAAARLVFSPPPEGFLEALRAAAPMLDAPPERPGVLFRRVAVWLSAAAASLAAIIFVIAPLLADLIAPLIPPEREQRMGALIVEDILTHGVGVLGIRGGQCGSPGGDAALAKLTERLTAGQTAAMPITVRVLRSRGAENAFALPGGQILLLEALVEAASGPEELAGILAHEIGHVTARDPTRNLLRAIGSGAVISLVLGDFTGGFVLAGLTDAAVNASYSREAERAADAAAMAMLAKAELPVAPLAQFFDRVEARYGASGGGILDTHPALAERRAAIRAEAARRGEESARFPELLTAAEWRALRTICDPR